MFGDRPWHGPWHPGHRFWGLSCWQGRTLRAPDLGGKEAKSSCKGRGTSGSKTVLSNLQTGEGGRMNFR